jgi:hypothetical protein
MAVILDVFGQVVVSHGERHCLRVLAMLKLALRRTLRGHCCASCGWAYREQIAVWAGVAQLVEHLICNQRVGGSSPFASSSPPQQEKKDGFGCTARPFWLCRPPVIPSRVVYPLDSQVESKTGFDRAEMVAARWALLKQDVHRWPSG